MSIRKELGEHLISVLNNRDYSASNHIIGAISDMRLEFLNQQEPDWETWQIRNIYTGTHGLIYKMTGIHEMFSFVFAYYNSQDILWIDDHLYDDDFSNFIKREQLHHLFYKPDELAQLLVSTKLAYILLPDVVNNISDIPDARFQQNEDDGHSILQKLANVIHEPQSIETKGDKNPIEFFIWTKIMGNIFQLQCYFDEANRFVYQGKQVASGMGDYSLGYK